MAATLAAARSASLVVWPNAAFDSDQAIVGLMAKHVAEGRALPATFYGQSYLLAIQAYLAAPLFAVGGASVTLLKLPLLGINALVAALLVLLLTRDGGLRPAPALLASAFFTLCPPVAGAQLVAAMGGSVEPFLYILLMWMTRRRPMICGIVAGIGVLHREFSVYGLSAVLAVELVSAWPAWRAYAGRSMTTLLACASVLALGNAAVRFGDLYGPEMPRFELVAVPSNLAAVTSRPRCDLGDELGPNLSWLTTHTLPTLVGTRGRGENEYFVGQPAPAAPWLWRALVAGLLLALVRSASVAWRLQTSMPPFVAFIGLAGIQSVVVYTSSCSVRDPALVRYALLALLVPIAVAAWHLRVEPTRWGRWTSVALLAGWMVWSAASHGRIVREYLQQPPVTPQSLVAVELERRGVRYGRASYWIAHHVTFLTGERVRLASDYPPRILIYDTEVSRASRTVDILSGPCPNGTQAGSLWICE